MPTPLIAETGLFEQFQTTYGKWRKKIAAKFAGEGVVPIDGFAGDASFCERLLTVYNSMRAAPRLEPPRVSTLLSHVPEWTRAYQVDDDISDQGFELPTIRSMPRLQAALANCTAYTPSKWLLEQELSKRFSNRTVAEAINAKQIPPIESPQANHLEEDTGSVGTPRNEIREGGQDAALEEPAVSDPLTAEFDSRTVDRLLSELPTPPPADAPALISRVERWEGGARSWTPDGPRRDVYESAADEQLTGLCLSGGGIRSATFCLGILQVLAAKDILKSFDYLSSVSGGGYIHQWLAAWIHREPTGLASVCRKLAPLPESQSLARAPEQINWLRRYSSYLTPQRGIFTVDTWTMLAIWFRNTFLNQLVLFAFFAVTLVCIRAVMHPFVMPTFESIHARRDLAGSVNDLWQLLFSLATVVCTLWAALGVGALFFGLSSLTKAPRSGGRAPWGALGEKQVASLIVAPGFLLSVIVSLAIAGVFRIPRVLNDLSFRHIEYMSRADTISTFVTIWVVYVFALNLAFTLGGDALRIPKAQRRKVFAQTRAFAFGMSAVLCALIPTTFILVGAVDGFRGHTVANTSIYLANELDALLGHRAQTNKAGTASIRAAQQSEHRVPPGALLAVLIPLVLLGGQLVPITLQMAILGRAQSESQREWLARYAAWTGIFVLSWIALGLIALIGPYIYYWLFDMSTARKIVSCLAVIIVHAITLFAGSSSKTSGVPEPRRFFGYAPLDLVGIIGAPIAIFILLIITSGWVDVLTDSSYQFVLARFSVSGTLPTFAGFYVSMFAMVHYELSLSGPFWAFLLYLGTLLLFGWRVDVNEFSLHPFYRDRLARCYIGASNGRRVPDPFTGFDDHSELSYSSITLPQLLPARFGGKAKAGGSRAAYDGPMPIFCSTVNLTFGQDLAFQDRKGTSFAFTPLYSGFHTGWTAASESGATTTFNGFVPTDQFAYKAEGSSIPGIPLTTCAAISGAALSPNQGYSSQPTLAFLMTLFNFRLGWWIANPRKPWIWPNELDQPTPRFGLRYLLAELFGYSDDTTNYVSLADGGRFDNMGLYELVRRRCSKIVICDGEQDDKTTFEGLGLAVAKARIDFGVEIKFTEGHLEALAPDPDTKLSKRHFATGTIQYPAPPGGNREDPKYKGKILYLKTAFVGDEPVDLLHYKREHPDFPQENTVNQWFTEAQFESYRRLGQLSAEAAFGVDESESKSF